MTARRRAAVAIGLCALASTLAPPARSDEPVGDIFPKLEIVGTAFRITADGGGVLSGSDLVGVVLTAGDPAGGRLALRIDAVRPDPEDPSGETMLYALSVQDPLTGEWQNACAPDAAGVAMGFPLSGIRTPAGEHVPSSDGAFSITCTSGASAKRVRMGYKPWQTAADGTALWAYHQACTRMVRADYCGDGAAHTREGTRIDVYDRLGVQVADQDPAMIFEAAWGPDGAVCVRRVRVPEAASLDELVRSCPDRLAGKVGGACTEEVASRTGEEALILNASVPAPGGPNF